ncbi:MAG: prepilin-type N-terminal cleavage/methylation domain-containing protein [Kiritimatiellae bacterium]|nr:prepilin-type N-terminal cleavage/methylation domain-containing protein [Kiritimatiellia bacterium]
MLREKKKPGFTLVELLVVIAIIAALAATLTPALSKALTNAALNTAVQNAKNIYTAVFEQDMRNVVFQGASAFSSGTNFTTSTEYFTNLVQNGVLSVPYSLFCRKEADTRIRSKLI